MISSSSRITDHAEHREAVERQTAPSTTTMNTSAVAANVAMSSARLTSAPEPNSQTVVGHAAEGAEGGDPHDQADDAEHDLEIVSSTPTTCSRHRRRERGDGGGGEQREHEHLQHGVLDERLDERAREEVVGDEAGEPVSAGAGIGDLLLRRGRGGRRRPPSKPAPGRTRLPASSRSPSAMTVAPKK